NSMSLLIISASLCVETASVHAKHLSVAPPFDRDVPWSRHRDCSASHVFRTVPCQVEGRPHLTHTHGGHCGHDECELYLGIGDRFAVRRGYSHMELRVGAALRC